MVKNSEVSLWRVAPPASHTPYCATACFSRVFPPFICLFWGSALCKIVYVGVGAVCIVLVATSNCSPYSTGSHKCDERADTGRVQWLLFHSRTTSPFPSMSYLPWHVLFCEPSVEVVSESL